MSSRKLKNNGTTNEVSLDKSKNYKYDKGGALVEATTIGDNDIVFSGSKSSLRRLSDLERNVSILAATLTTTDGETEDAEDANFDGIFTAPARFRSTTRFDGAIDVRAAVAMNNTKITGLGTPTTSTDASTKAYVDSVASATQTATIAAVTGGAGAAFDTLVEIQNAMATDAELSSAIAAITTVANATKLATARNIQGVAFDGTAAITVVTAGTGISVSGTTVTNTITNNNQLTNGNGYYSSGSAPSFGATSTGALTVSGGITATGEITAYYSDVNLKKDIVAITDPIAKVMALRGVTYRPNEAALALGITDKEEVGVIAQEVEAVLPQLVCPSAFEGYKTVKYEKLTALLLEAVKAQQTQIEALTAQVAKLSGL